MRDSENKEEVKMLYVLLISGANLIIIAANILLGALFEGCFPSAAEALCLTPISTVAVILVDAIAAFAIRRLPGRFFSHGSRLCSVSKGECSFYNKLGVRRWREKIPELGMFTGFHKNKVYEPGSIEYIKRYILEANYGAVIHFASVPLGFLIILLRPSAALSVGIPVAIVNALLNLLPAFVLRYNLPKLLSLLRINERRQKKKEETV